MACEESALPVKDTRTQTPASSFCDEWGEGRRRDPYTARPGAPAVGPGMRRVLLFDRRSPGANVSRAPFTGDSGEQA
jgi:hypothetical protein